MRFHQYLICFLLALGFVSMDFLLRPRTATTAAESKMETARSRLARQRIAFTEKTFVQNARDGRKVIVEQFLVAGMNKDAKNEVGDTALVAATRNNRLEVMRILLDRQADPNQLGIEGLTALMIAVRNDQTSTLR